MAVSTWQLWTLPGRLQAYLCSGTVLSVLLAAASLVRTPWRWSDLASWAAFVTCGVIAIEGARKAGEPAGASRDMLAAWTLPIALLLPPVYALLAPIPLTAWKQVRVGRSPLYRRVFSAASLGMEGFARSVVFHLLLGPLARAVSQGGARAALAVGVGLGCAVVLAQLNTLVIATAAKMATPELTWAALLWQRENLVLDLGELCVGVLVALAWTVTPVSVLVALPPMMLLHRSLTHAQLRAAARTDAKTGLLNPTSWQQEAEREIARALRVGRPLAVVIADLDHFKAVNDTYGHLIGDQLLIAAADALRASSRSYDVLGRFGGEEFVALLPDTDPFEAQRITRRLGRQVAAATVPADDGEPVQVTVSIGAAVLGTNGSDLTELLHAADIALYQAKSAGRDRVLFAPGSIGQTGE
jgi:diguanylate cyclase (GGDEF)-like protein